MAMFRRTEPTDSSGQKPSSKPSDKKAATEKSGAEDETIKSGIRGNTGYGSISTDDQQQETDSTTAAPEKGKNSPCCVM